MRRKRAKEKRVDRGIERRRDREKRRGGEGYAFPVGLILNAQRLNKILIFVSFSPFLSLSSSSCIPFSFFPNYLPPFLHFPHFFSTPQVNSHTSLKPEVSAFI